MKYLALGDSISIDDYTGVRGGGAVSQFARLIQADAVEDLTRDGQMTDGVLAGLERLTFHPDIVTLTAGGNDFLLATFRATSPSNTGTEEESSNYWLHMADSPLANLRRIAAHLATFRCPVLMNTVYDPTDGDDTLSEEIGISPDARQTFRALNAGIQAIAQEHGFLLADLETLFRGHGLQARESWIVMNIEPNYPGATAIALHWHRLYCASRPR